MLGAGVVWAHRRAEGSYGLGGVGRESSKPFLWLLMFPGLTCVYMEHECALESLPSPCFSAAPGNQSEHSMLICRGSRNGVTHGLNVTMNMPITLFHFLKKLIARN